MENHEHLDRYLSQWEQWEKLSRVQLKAARELQEAALRGDLKKVQKQLIGLKQPLPELPEVGLLTDLQEWCQQEERQRPLRLAKQLRELALTQELELHHLGQEPPTFRLGDLTLEFDFSRGQAHFSYARLPLVSLTLQEQEILKEYHRQLQILGGDDFHAEEYLAKLFEAYRRLLFSQGLKAGERVDLVDLLPELTFLLQTDKFRRELSRETFRPYSKVRLAYDLARLRRSRHLEVQGQRLSLGTATLGSTRSKERVLFLEEAGQGQYYLSLAFQGVSAR